IIDKVDIINSKGEPLFEIPLSTDGKLLLNYRGPQKTIPHISVSEVLSESDTAEIETIHFNEDGTVNSDLIEIKTVNKKEWFKDRIFILGASALAIYDLRVTPFDRNMPGPETHLNVIDNLLRQDFLKIHKDEEMYMPLSLFFIGVLASLVISYLGAVSGFFTTIIMLATVLIVDKHIFFLNGWVVTIIFPLILILSLYIFMTFYKYFTEERSKKELRGTFSKYVSPSIVDEILKDPENLELGGKKQNMTVLFSDIRGFTTISEMLDPKALSELLNSYLTPMTELVFEHKGTLDKYMGDAVMAFFGAPVQYPDHAAHACRCALSHIKKLKELQIEYEKKGLPQIDIGIGINTGEMSVGNMGSETVRSYTVMGDAVNLGSRLEGINKEYGTRIIISEFTYQDVKDSFICREIDWVRVKGKNKPVKIFELIDEGSTSVENAKMLKHFNKGFELYHQKMWTEAIEQFNLALNHVPEDVPSKLYIQRCETFIKQPPPEDWDGVYVMTTK
ncbi:MAG: adenylate/guanylate cyclase domain-containing protein, partial [Bdellovibrionales bacterium]|nr:adenylate/guanylate cyclase domain-containing protein [Bdellovibrionales bacterium]